QAIALLPGGLYQRLHGFFGDSVGAKHLGCNHLTIQLFKIDIISNWTRLNRPHLHDVSSQLDGKLLEKLKAERAYRHPGGRLASRGSFEHVPYVLLAELEGARQIGMTGTEFLDCFLFELLCRFDLSTVDLLDRHDMLPVVPVFVL